MNGIVVNSNRTQDVSTSLLRTTAISALGGVFEFYDFVIFAVFAPHIGATFFPSETGSAGATLKAFAVFAVGYLARPIGGILWAHVGDRRGRAYVFSHTVLGMAASTLLIGLLPGYAMLGLAAPVLLVALRLLQGMALGGEIPSSLCWLSEHAGQRRSGLVTATLLAGVNSGMLLGQGVALVIERAFGSEQALDWAWRLAFLFGSLVGVVAYFVRRHVGETAEFTQLHQNGCVERLPLKTLLREAPRQVVAGWCMCALHAWIVAALYLALPSYLERVLKIPLGRAEAIALVSAGMGSALYICAGWLGDMFGARRVCVVLCVAVMLAAIPGYALMERVGPGAGVALGALAGSFIGAYLGLLPGMFAPAVRVSGLAVAYDGAFAVVGGLGPLVMLSSADRFGWWGPAVLLVVAAAVALLGLCLAGGRPRASEMAMGGLEPPT